MEDKVKAALIEKAINILWKIIIPLLKFFLIIYFFGGIALGFGFLCVAFENVFLDADTSFWAIFNGNLSEQEALRIFFKWIAATLDSIPFHNLFELLMQEDGGILSQTADFFVSFTNGKFAASFTQYAPMLFKDVTHTTLAAFLFFVFSRLNRFLIPRVNQNADKKSFGDRMAGIAFGIVCAAWTFCSFCASHLILSFVDKYVIPEKKDLAYLLIIVFAFLFHMLFLSLSLSLDQRKRDRLLGKAPYESDFDLRGLRALIIFSIRLLFDVIKAIIVWLVGCRFLKLYCFDYTLNDGGAFLDLFLNRSKSACEILFLLFVYLVFDALESFCEETLTFKLYSFFNKKSIQKKGGGKRGFRF